MTATETKPLKTAAPTSQQLNRLGFVPKYSNLISGYASGLYSTAKGYVPASLKPKVNSVEQFAAKHGSPVVTKLADGSQELLLVADSQIDGAIKSSYTFYSNSTKELQSLAQNKHIGEHFAATRDSVVKRFQDALSFIQTQGVAGSARTVKDTTFAQASGLFEYFKKVLGVSQEKYLQVHDQVVATPTYKKVVEINTAVVTKVQETPLYKTAAQRLYPVISPYADPALEKIISSPYYKATVEHLKPIPAAA